MFPSSILYSPLGAHPACLTDIVNYNSDRMSRTFLRPPWRFCWLCCGTTKVFTESALRIEKRELRAWLRQKRMCYQLFMTRVKSDPARPELFLLAQGVQVRCSEGAELIC